MNTLTINCSKRIGLKSVAISKQAIYCRVIRSLSDYSTDGKINDHHYQNNFVFYHWIKKTYDQSYIYATLENSQTNLHFFQSF